MFTKHSKNIWKMSRKNFWRTFCSGRARKKWLLSRNKKLFTFIELEILFEQAQISVCLGDFLATLIFLRFNFESETDTKERIKERRSFTLLLNNFINVSYKNFTFNYRVVEWNIVKSSSLILFVSRKEEKYTRECCLWGRRERFWNVWKSSDTRLYCISEVLRIFSSCFFSFIHSDKVTFRDYKVNSDPFTSAFHLTIPLFSKLRNFSAFLNIQATPPKHNH